MFTKSLELTITGLLTAAILSSAWAGPPTSDFAVAKKPPSATAYGKTYGEWSAEWWKWILEIPAYENPILDPDGSFADIGQRGKVWFLAGTAGGSAERWVTVPEGKALFFALVNHVWFHCQGEERTEEEMRGDLAWSADHYCQLHCTLNDSPDDPDSIATAITTSNIVVVTQSPVFEFVVPEDFIWADTCEEPYSPPEPGTVLEDNISGGVWVMIPPLEAGEYELYVHGAMCDPESGELWFEPAVTWHLTIEENDDD